MRAIHVRRRVLFASVCVSMLGCSAASNDEPSSQVSDALGAAKNQSFATPTSWGRDLMGNTGWRKERHPRLLADVNHDGKKDLVGFGDAGVWLALSNGAHFDAARFVLADFGVANQWSLDKHVRTMGDVNGDGREDVVGFGDAGVWTALSTGAGFGPAQFVLADFGYDHAWRVEKHVRVLADVNGDGRKDIVGFGDAGVSLALGQASGGFGPATFVIADAGFNQGWTPSKHVRTVADVNGDGRDDIVAFGDAGVWTALSTGSGFGPFRFVLASFGFTAAAGNWRVDLHPRVLADVDGDGKKDIVGFANDGVWTARATGDGGFAPPTRALAAFGYSAGWDAGTARLVGDLNHDGYADIVGYAKDSSIVRALGGPTGFAAPRTMLQSYVGDPALTALADVDGNGAEDLVGYTYADAVVARSSDAAPRALPRPILETEMVNPAATNTTRCGGQTFLDHGEPVYEWTPMVPSGADDQYGADTAVSGTAIHPERSGADMPFTHPFYSEMDGNNYDFEYYVAPDPRYFSVLTDSNDPLANPKLPDDYTNATVEAGSAGAFAPGVIGMEMDGAAVPTAYRAMKGDRVALFGRWIEDCGHDDFHKEIHPPLMQVIARSESADATTSMVVGRPFLVSQNYGDGGLRAHFIDEVEKLAELRSTRIEAHPPVLKPFTGVHILSYLVRPPTPRRSPADRLLLSYHFTLRSGVAVQAVDAGDDAIRVVVVMNEAGYPFDVGTLFPGRQDWAVDVGALDSDARDAIRAATAAAVLLLPFPLDVNVTQGLNRDFLTDRYPTPHAVSAQDGVNAAVRVWSKAIPANVGYAVDNGQPFPIYGSMRLEWQRPIVAGGGAISAGGVVGARL